MFIPSSPKLVPISIFDDYIESDTSNNLNNDFESITTADTNPAHDVRPSVHDTHPTISSSTSSNITPQETISISPIGKIGFLNTF